MSIALPLFALVALILAAVFWSMARTSAAQLAKAQAELKAIDAAHAELKENSQQRSQKDKSRGGELEELREKQKDLRRRLNEAQEQAKKLKDQDDSVHAAEREARAQADQARAEAAEASRVTRTLRAELEQVRTRRPTRNERLVDLEAEVKAVAVVAAPVIAAAPAPAGPALAELEAKLKERDARLAELDARVKSEQRKGLDAGRELERMKAKGSTSEKLYVVQKGELELWKDRYRMLEQRLNKTLREVDALHRGVLALERRLPQKSVEEARAEVVVAQAEADKQAQAAEAAKAAAEAKAAADAAKAAADAAKAAAAPVPPPPPREDVASAADVAPEA